MPRCVLGLGHHRAQPACPVDDGAEDLENWLLWIAVDLLGIGVYQARGLYATAGLYLVFLILATCGLVAWWRAFDAERKSALASA